jgi:hypothetical protein
MTTKTNPLTAKLTAQDSARQLDNNGWIEIRNNPISKIGVFEYRGSSIGGQDPNKIYKVYRPEQSLNNPDTINSFKLLPWIDDHKMLGDLGVPTEQKGVSGVIGEEVYYEAPYLKATIKVFSQAMTDKIQSGEKIELSAGYACTYDWQSGVTQDGVAYDCIQTQMRGNHLALVDEGRMGHDVKVMDSADRYFSTIDSKDIIMPENEVQQPTLADVLAAILALTAMLKPVAAEAKAEEAQGEGAAMGEVLPDDANKDEAEPKEGDPEGKEGKPVGTDSKDRQIATLSKQVASLTKTVAGIKAGGMDAAISGIAKRDALVSKLTPVIGAFDHSLMSEQAVANYAVKKLGLTGCDGVELVAINAYLQAQPKKSAGYTLDSTDTSAAATAAKYGY